MNQIIAPFLFACPACRAPLQEITPDELHCAGDGVAYRRIDGIWRLFPAQAQNGYARFMAEYEQIRQAEGRGSADPAFYRALPFKDLTGRFSADWQVRARGFQTLLHKLVEPLERHNHAPLKVADLGAGNGWLSYRLAQRGHHLAAVDVLINPLDGLGAWVQYDAPFIPVQADFDHLPFQGAQFDLVIFNASLHYSTRYETTLCEAWRLIKPGGVLAILDSPIYHQADSGEQMVREREEHFRQLAGFPSNALQSENFLTYERLAHLAADLGVRWQTAHPAYGLGWALRPWKAKLRGRREPAEFALTYATRGVGTV
jgi:SAM-dependent methyltransferase